MSTHTLAAWCSSHVGCPLLACACRATNGPGTAFVAKCLDSRCILLSTVHCFLEGDEFDLQSEKPDELTDEIDKEYIPLRKRICKYYYRFCYKKPKEFVELQGSDFVAESFEVEYDVVSMCRQLALLLLYVKT